MSKNRNKTLLFIISLMLFSFALSSTAIAKKRRNKKRKRQSVQVQITPELKKKCAADKAAGKPLTPDCKQMELQMVMDGGVKKERRQVKLVGQVQDGEASDAQTGSIGPAITFDEAPTIDSIDNKDRDWKAAEKEPPLFPDEPKGHLFVGLSGGYSFLLARSSDVVAAYKPLMNLSFHFGYQLFPMFQVALVADLDMLKGQSFNGMEYNEKDEYLVDDTDDPFHKQERNNREIAYEVEDYIGFGIRPTFRLNKNVGPVEMVLGAGIGWHYAKTKGRWTTTMDEDDFVFERYGAMDDEDHEGYGQAKYAFLLQDHGLYYAVDLSATYRFLEQRIGVGLLIKYTSMVQGRFEPMVRVDEKYGEDEDDDVLDDLASEDWDEKFQARESDYADTVVRHLGSFSLLSLCGTIDVRF